MPDFSKRSTEEEIMDDFTLPETELFPVLEGLERINTVLGGYQVFYDAFKQLNLKSSETVSDWGCGGGDGLRKLARWAKRRHLSIRFTGLDATPATIRFAKLRAASFSNIKFIQADVLKDVQAEKYDYVISSLFTHHFDDRNWVVLIQKMLASCRKAVIINDLHRHPLAYYSFIATARLFSRTTMIRQDGALSVLRSFTKQDLVNLLQGAGIKKYKIKWMWAFRWQIIIYKT
ncbi:methyltransferase domain-containing protein [Mucilaginibacter arboris]|uniref:Methyltransferase domain-containing protein n=1 Tax=Mucilaginibacter arboris TaxID=2682090 RepID=A0A7K1SZT5_9SPHI|nr:methyltransferase domain-containing protein [Mucilaginibacter arboris]MVN22834.1 methyltransferase domain-containing protein [Mucilaginibacter arboris]